jgi:hypothetical protein
MNRTGKHARKPTVPFTTYTINQEWLCLACGQLRAFGWYVLANWNTPLIFTCDCDAKWQMQRGNVRRVER